jgi:hypothetical protein
MRHHKFLLGDQVRYTGSKLRSLGKKNAAWGIVVGYVKGQLDHLVIDFGSDAYVVDEADLTIYVFTEKEKGPEIIKISKKWDDE